MKERPILFNAPMVRAVLDGSKTQTRRVVKYRITGPNKPDETFDWYDEDQRWRGAHGGSTQFSKTSAALLCPYGQVGDQLWGRETFKQIASGEVKNGYGEVRYGYAFKADDATRWNASTTIIRDLSGQSNTGHMQFKPRPWTPSIHMPRSASRIQLEITDVRVERLNDISQKDALAEGAPPSHSSIDRISRQYGYSDFSRSWFAQLWDSVYGAKAWAANPWVWVITFKRVNP